MSTGESPNVLNPSIALDRGEVDAEVMAGRVRPPTLHQQIQIRAAVLIGNMPIDDSVIDDIPAVFTTEAHNLPLNAIALAIDPDHQQQCARRDSPADIRRLRRAVAQLFPWRR